VPDSEGEINLRRYRAFIFDLDGTLINSDRYHVNAFSQAIEQVSGYRISDAERREFTGNTTFDLSRELAKRHGLDLDPNDIVRIKFHLLYQHFRTEPFPDTTHFIERWKQHVSMAIASNSPLHFVERVLHSAGWYDSLGVVTTIDDVKRRKPDPEMLELTLARLQTDANETLVFEDSMPGLHAAQAARCDAVLLNNPGHRLPEVVPKGTPIRSWTELCLLPTGPHQQPPS